MYSKPPFRVLIIGGSVSGLTLANALDRANIDFMVLEKRPDVVFGAGAALGLLPNGLRILDQLDIFSELMMAGTPIHTMINRWKDGQAFSKSHFTQRIQKR
jgi:FAD dependent monooxygenase